MPEKILATKSKSENQDRKDIVFEEVAELELPIKIIIEKIRPRIEKGEYGLIIGDDASGRIPTLILGNFIKKVSESKGINVPNIIFIPGKLIGPFLGFGSESMRKKLEDHINKFGAILEKRILIVTDTVLTGQSLKTLVGLLREIGFTCDIATIGVETDEKDLSDRDGKLQNSEVISGEFYTEDHHMHNTPKIYKEKTLSGVTKKVGQTRSTTIKSGEFDEENKEMVQIQINQTREDAGIVTDHLVDWYESQQKENEK